MTSPGMREPPETPDPPSATSDIRVLVVDDHPLAQEGLRYFLYASPWMQLVGTASSGEEALALCDGVRPDVVLMDLMMPGIGGVETTRRLKARFPQVRVLVLSSFPDGDLVEEALRAGASGYLLKTATAFEVAQGVRAAHAGRAVLAPEATEALAAAMHRGNRPGSDLTERERDVLALMAEGLPNEQIGARLSITPATVKYHAGSIFSKLGVATRAEAVALAYRHRLVT
jgi:two-component system, NarL family, response regulator LiaR